MPNNSAVLGANRAELFIVRIVLLHPFDRSVVLAAFALPCVLAALLLLFGFCVVVGLVGRSDHPFGLVAE